MALDGLQMPRLVEVDTDSLSENYGKFIMQPLERGFGVSIGHALRRVLVSSIQGAGIKSVSIEGVQHEFSVVKGDREDLPEIILNLKEVALRYHGDEDRILRVEATGPGTVTAASCGRKVTGIVVTYGLRCVVRLRRKVLVALP